MSLKPREHYVVAGPLHVFISFCVDVANSPLGCQLLISSETGTPDYSDQGNGNGRDVVMLSLIHWVGV